MNAKRMIEYILSLPRSAWLNLRLFGIEGTTMPILFSNRTRIRGMKRGSVQIDAPLRPAMIRIGFGGSECVAGKRSGEIKMRGGVIVFRGTAFLAEGILLRVDNGRCEFGEKFFCNRNCSIMCEKEITFGDEVLIGWETNFRDSSGHQSYCGNRPANTTMPINIGDHVWIAACVDVLKGSCIQDGSIVGYRSLVTHSFVERNALIAGAPAKLVRTDMSWKV